MIYIAFSFVLFCIPIQDKIVFDHLYEIVSPYTFETTQAVGSYINNGIDKTQKMGSKLFDNITPKKSPTPHRQANKIPAPFKRQKDIDDKVKSILSGTKKRTERNNLEKSEKEIEEYDLSDKEALNSLFGH